MLEATALALAAWAAYCIACRYLLRRHLAGRLGPRIDRRHIAYWSGTRGERSAMRRWEGPCGLPRA